jgi:6-bladed beta-propeller protein
MRPRAIRFGWIASVAFSVDVLVTILGCTERTRTRGLHPDPRYIDNSISPGYRIGLWAPLSRPPPFTVGSPARAAYGGGGDSAFFGRIKAIGFLGSGDIVVVDEILNDLRLFTGRGTPIGRVGRAGPGPGEFRDPRSLAVDRAGRLYVGDAIPHVQVFAPGPGGYQFERALPTTGDAQGICALGDWLVVQSTSFTRPDVPHVVDSAGTERRAFGLLYRSPNPGINDVASLGEVACDVDHQLIFLAAREMLGEVRAFRLDGVPVWRTVFDGYRNTRIEDYGSGYKVTASRAVSPTHSLACMTLVPGIGLLVQWSQRTYEELRDRASYGTIISFLLDPATGRPTPLGTTLPPIMAATATEVAVVYEDPVPRFEVRPLLKP